MSTDNHASSRIIPGGEDIFNLISSGEVVIENSGKYRDFRKAAKIFTCYYQLDRATFYSSPPTVADLPVDIREMKYNPETKTGSNFQKIFGLLPGSWEKNCLRHQQVWDFCQKNQEHLTRNYGNTFFLVKIDEKKPIEWNISWKNACILSVEMSYNPLGETMGLQVYSFNSPVIWDGRNRHRLVTPVLTNLGFKAPERQDLIPPSAL